MLIQPIFDLFPFLDPWFQWVFPLFGFLFLAYFFAPLLLWTVFLFLCFVLFFFPSPLDLAVFFFFALLFNISTLRSFLISLPVMKILRALQFLPTISETEKSALKAGVVWVESELFSGRPSFKRLFEEQRTSTLTQEEEDFLKGPVEELCQKVDDWKIWQSRKIPDDIFQFIKEKKFFGMIVPKNHGGLGFSARAHSEVIMKVSRHSLALGIVVMVPNSLGPAELLIHYGTEAQKKRYLKNLACGKEIPCFGLTEPTAGSDAGSITSEGVLFKDKESGKICLRLNWNKRWITLASISTLLGIAFRLKDPEHLIGDVEDVGITCALISSQAKGVVVGRRHDPLGIPFHNCPTQGKNVEVDAEEAIIGGLKGAGKGWSMLMECLSAGRGISLPALSTGGVQLMTQLVSAHAVVRKQFGISIGKFEGVEESLARIAGAAYFLEALRLYTLSALDQGIKPPVVTAITKYNATEIFRKRVNDAMDILGGAGISMGPHNRIAIPYISAPISITVEGANILTRTLIIFGQGLFRAHPYVFDEIEAVEKKDLKAFDASFWGHVGHVFSQSVRVFVLSLTRAFLVVTPFSGRAQRYAQKLSWVSSSFALLADVSMLLFGGKLKLKEKLSGRFADVFSWMYIATATLKRFQSENSPREDIPFLDYSLKLAFFKIQRAFEGILSNFDHLLFGWIFKGPILWLASLNKLEREPSDRVTHKISQLIMTPGRQRNHLIQPYYEDDGKEKSSDPVLARLERALKLIVESKKTERKMRAAIRQGLLSKKPLRLILDEALEKKVLSSDEYNSMKEAEELRWNCIQVDDFSEIEYVSRGAAQG